MEEPSFSTVLIEDVRVTLERLNDGHPRERRTAIRAAFAAVEGHLSMLCQELLERAGVGLTETERMALREETYRVTASGKIETAPAHFPLKSRVKLVTAIVKRLHPEYAIDFQGSGWQGLLAGLEIRDRITHPKNLRDMDITFEEAGIAVLGVFWFLREVIGPGHGSIAAYLAEHPPGLAAADLARYGYGSVWGSSARAAPLSPTGPAGEEDPPTA